MSPLPPRHSSSTASAIALLRSWSRVLLERPPALLDREHAARDLDHRRRALRAGEVLRKAIGVDRGRGDDHLQIGPARQDLAQVAEQEVDVQAALVRLVDDQRVVGAQQRVALRLGEQDAVGHQLDAGAGRAAGPGSAPCSRRRRRAASSVPARCAWPRSTRRCAAAACGRSVARRSHARPSASASLGNCVVLPEPVSPQTMTTWLPDSACAISSRRAETGSDSGKVIGGRAGVAAGGSVPRGAVRGGVRGGVFKRPGLSARGFTGDPSGGGSMRHNPATPRACRP